MSVRILNQGYELVPATELELHPKNANMGDLEELKASIDVNGFYGAVTANKRTRRVLTGNHRDMALVALGSGVIPTIWIDVSEEEEERILVVDNELTRKGKNDQERLAALLSGLAATPLGLKGTGYTQANLDHLLTSLHDSRLRQAPAVDPDDLPPAPPTRCKRGDLWALGAHLLLIGDSREATDVARVMGGDQAVLCWTDPPYGVDYVGKTAEALTIENDGEEDLPDLLSRSFANITAALRPGSPVYVAHPAGPISETFIHHYKRDWRMHQQLIWVKDVFVLGHSDYHYMHEPILFGYTKGGSGRSGRGGANWYGPNNATTVFVVPRPKASEDHPTMKPVALVEPMLKNSSPVGGLVFEPFCGSGTTLIACEQTGRVCRAIELDPKYADKIIARWEKLTGKEARRCP